MKELIKQNKILNFLLLILVLNSCSEVKEKNNTDITISNEEAFSIFQSQYLLKPDTVYLPNFAGYMAAENDDVLLVLKSFGGTWQEQYRHQKFIQEINHEFDWAMIDSIPYLFYAIESAGNASGVVTFNLISLENNKEHSISFGGNIGEYGSMYPISNELKNQKSLLAYLEKKVAQSELVYHPTKEELDIDNPKNYAKKWRVENQNIYEKLKLSNGPLKIIFPNYESNLFDEVRHGSLNCSEENEMYIIKSYFKDDVIGHNKNNNKYFTVWVPEYLYDHIQFIKFRTPSVILLKNDSEAYEINFDDQSIINIKSNEW